MQDGFSIHYVNGYETSTRDLEERPLFWHFPHYRGNDPESWPYSIIRQGNWKLIRFDDTNQIELYDLLGDPTETTDVAGENADLSKKLLKTLDEHLDSVGARRVKPNPNYQQSP